MTEICDNWVLIDGITQYFMGETNPINPVIGVDDKGIVLIDTGPPGSYEQMKSGLKKLGFSVQDVRKIILTHYHFDHVGNLASFLQDNSEIDVYIGKDDIPYYEGMKTPEPSTPDMNEIKKYFPKATEETLIEMSSDPDLEPVKVDISKLEPLSGNGIHFDFAGGFDIVETPGHTPGHLSVYIPSSKVLIPGDLMMYWKGKFSGPVKTFSGDFNEAVRSVKKISKLDSEKLICYHGTPFSGNVNALIDDYLGTFEH